MEDNPTDNDPELTLQRAAAVEWLYKRSLSIWMHMIVTHWRAAVQVEQVLRSGRVSSATYFIVRRPATYFNVQRRHTNERSEPF